MINNKKPVVKPPLSLVEIITRADAATIQAALEARQKIDALLAERAAAYERIAALEKQVDEVMGAPNLFVFPPPAVSVAPFATPSPSPAPSPAKAEPSASADHGEPPQKKAPQKSGN